MSAVRKLLFIALANFLLYTTAIGQKNASPKMVKISSALRAGLLNGQVNKAGSELQVVSGINFKTWFTGLGAGIDYYSNSKSIPLFIDIRKDLKESESTFFINGDVGYNLPLRPNDKSNQSWIRYDFEGGLYYELGAGYKFILTKSLALALSAGYSYKNFKEKDSAYYGIGPFDQPLPPTVDIYDYKFRRLSIKLAFWF
ncbi:MAG: hypothetical protein ABIR19_08600 [Ginsengibacter sp.]